MHPSYFALLKSSEEEILEELPLSPEVSEWLFSIGFWQEINLRYSTDFSQYEEETIPSSLLDEVLTILSRVQSGLSGNDGSEQISFRFGWDANKNELICAVNRDAVASELLNLISFLTRAKQEKLDVYCQL